MRWASATRLLFVLYCAEIGFFLFIAPWGGAWERAAVQLPLASLRNLYLNPLFRSGVAGFGLVHLVWSVHDLQQWLSRRRHEA